MTNLTHQAESAPKPFPTVTVVLIIINVLVFLWALSLSGRELAGLFDRWALVPVQLVGNGSAELPTLLTGIFLHGGWTHLLGNMLFLWVFGDMAERQFGKWRMLALYFGSGLIASIAQMLIEPFSPIAIIGASGAVAGLLGAHIARAWNPKQQPNNINFGSIRLFFFSQKEQPVILLLAFWFILQFFNGVAQIGSVQSQNGGVAFFAHIGGFVAGLIVARSFGRSGE